MIDLVEGIAAYRLRQRQPEPRRHVRDIASIVLYQAGALDQAYIERWVQTLNLSDEWQEIQRRVAAL